MKFQKTMFIFFVALTSVFLLTSARVAWAQESEENPVRDIPVNGMIEGGGSFNGTLTVEQFTAEKNVLLAKGKLSGVLRGPEGEQMVRDVPVTLPVTRIDSPSGMTCQILHLELGPVDLDLLGLRVHLNRVVLDITAVRGPGRLLGNLLCAIAHLLDGTPSLSDVLVPLLNHLLHLVNFLFI